MIKLRSHTDSEELDWRHWHLVRQRTVWSTVTVRTQTNTQQPLLVICHHHHRLSIPLQVC